MNIVKLNNKYYYIYKNSTYYGIYSGIPLRYEIMDYIESSGTQWIDTGVTPNQTFSIKAKFSNVNTGTQSVAGIYDADLSYIWGIGQQQSGNYLFGQYYGPSSERIVSNIQGNDGVVRTLELRKNTFYIDDTLIGSKTEKFFSTNISIKLFTLNPTGSRASVKLYSAQITQDSTLVRNFVPVYDTITGKYGMWETVQRKFYGNDGTGDFSGGKILYAPVLNGTEQIITLQGQTSPTISNNMLVGGSGYLAQGWDNSGLWKLKFKAYSTNPSSIDNAIIVCSSNATQRDQDEFLITNGGSIYIYYNGSQVGYDTTLLHNVTCYQTWREYTITKTSATNINVSSGNYQVNITWNALSSYNRVCIGVDKWQTAYMEIKEIFVTEI